MRLTPFWHINHKLTMILFVDSIIQFQLCLSWEMMKFQHHSTISISNNDAFDTWNLFLTNWNLISNSRYWFSPELFDRFEFYSENIEDGSTTWASASASEPNPRVSFIRFYKTIVNGINWISRKLFFSLLNPCCGSWNPFQSNFLTLQF